MKLHELDIQTASKGLRKKEFSCNELVSAALESVENNKHLNAFLTVNEEAIVDAKKLDTRMAHGEVFHPLAGIPFSVKDALCTKGLRSTAGVKILDNYLPPYTATTVARLLEKHGILIGKTNCDGFGHGASNENSSYGPVKNPFDITRVAGGSSGGSGAAVAASCGQYSIGEDTGGSVRNPAAFCGVVGLKVSYGRNSRYGAMPMASSLDTVGPLAKTVYDVALVEEVIAGHDVHDATTITSSVPKYTDFLEQSISGMKAGIPKEYFSDGVADDVRRAVETVLEVAKTLGVEIKDVSLPMTKYAIATYYILVPSEDSSNLARIDGMRYGMRSLDKKNINDLYAYSRSEGLPDEVKRRIMIGTYALSTGYNEAYYLKAQKVRTLIRKDFERVFKEVDFLITPTQPTTAFKIGEKADDPLKMYLADMFVIPASVAGIPALSIPCGNDASGLPIGAQIIVPFLREESALNVGYQLEQAIGYKHHGN